MKRTLLLFLLSAPLWADPKDEELSLRRILTLTQEEEFDLAKIQLDEFFAQFPSHPQIDKLVLLRGDIAFKEKNYKEAISYYDEVRGSSPHKKNATLKKWHALYQLKNYQALLNEIPASVANESSEGSFYRGESCFRLGTKEKKEDRKLIQEAACYFTALKEHPIYGRHARLSLAQIAKIQGKKEEADALLLSLGKELKEGEDALFLHIARSLSQDHEKVAKAYLEDLLKRGKHKEEASTLLFSKVSQNFEELNCVKELLEKSLPKHLLGALYLTFGKYYLEKKELKTALIYLEKSDAAGESRASLPLATTLRENGEPEKALKVLECSSSCDLNVQKEKVRLLIDLDRAKEAHDLAEKIKDIRLMIQASLKQKNQEPCEKIERQLVDEVQEGLKHSLFTPAEKLALKQLLATSLVSLKEGPLAIKIIDELLEEGESFELHLLALSSNLQKGNCEKEVILHGERALQLSNNPVVKKVHLPLFNAYLELGNDKKAAEHLYEAALNGPISLENRLWLAKIYSKEALSGNEEAASKGIALLKPLVKENPAQFQEEALNLASLFAELEEFEKEKEVLDALKALPLKHEVEVKLACALNAKKLGSKEEAALFFQELQAVSNVKISQLAKLELARLLFEKIPSEKRKVNDPDTMAILKALKEIQARRFLHSEPIHLEAALEYAETVALLAPPEKRRGVLLKAMKEVKEDFVSKDDLLSKDYHDAMATNSEKEALYNDYMRYIDARILQLQAKEPTDEKAALALFSSIKSGRKNHRALQERANQALKGIPR